MEVDELKLYIDPELREESIREYARFRIKNKDVESVRPLES